MVLSLTSTSFRIRIQRKRMRSEAEVEVDNTDQILLVYRQDQEVYTGPVDRHHYVLIVSSLHVSYVSGSLYLLDSNSISYYSLLLTI